MNADHPMNNEENAMPNGTAHDFPPLQKGTLYLVATPIGNMEDITLRAIRTLKDCDVIAAEDTRRTGLLLQRLGFRKPLLSYHTFNEARRENGLIQRLKDGQIIALVTDAGSPGISDPGQRIASAAIEAGLRVESVPGPCAFIAALSSSGLPTDRFYFLGFLPHKSGQRNKALSSALACPGVVALYESPYRIEKLLHELQTLAPERSLVLARELTKKFEEWFRGTPAELIEKTSTRSLKGEFVVLIGPSKSNPPVIDSD
jgi:16S rRNA (cytidine1402-2'-O)-methyltransferase